MKYGIIFDLDGTLLDTLEDLYLSVNATMEKMGFPKRTKEEVCSFVGNGVPKLIERSLPDFATEKDFDLSLDFFKKYYGVHCMDNTCPYEGILTVLSEIKRCGYGVGVVSNKVDFAVRELCDRLFFGLVDVCRGQVDGVPTKPSPESVFAVMEKMNSEKFIYVGDSDVDILTAKNAKIPCISVSWGFRSAEFLRENGAEHIVGNTKELVCVIDELCKE